MSWQWLWLTFNALMVLDEDEERKAMQEAEFRQGTGENSWKVYLEEVDSGGDYMSGFILNGEKKCLNITKNVINSLCK